jgi:hypothetical protein
LNDWKFKYLSYAELLDAPSISEFKLKNHNKLLIINLHEQLGFNQVCDLPEKILFNLSKLNHPVYIEDLLRYLVPDIDSKFNHAFLYEEDKPNRE